ncbi:MAG: HAMP domain-containing protein, partial [Pedococcus sp.]
MTAPTTPLAQPSTGPPTATPTETKPPRHQRILARASRRLEALPLRLRLIAVMLVLLLLALTLTASATAVLMRRDLLARVDQGLRVAAEPVARQGLARIIRGSSAPLPTTYAFVLLPTDGSNPIVVNPTGIDQHPKVPALPLDDPRVTSGRPFTLGSASGPLEWRAVAGNFENDTSATFVVAVPLTSVDHTVKRLVLVELLIGITVLVACAVGGGYAVHRAFRPLRQIEDTASAIAAGDLTRRVPTRTAKDEVTSLSRSLNVMLAQIEQSFAQREQSEERMRQFVADASHELRTPLAAV